MFAGSVDPAGFDGVDVDAMVEQFDGDSSHHVIQSALGGTVGHAVCERPVGLDTGNEHDLATFASFDHMPGHELADMESGEQSTVERLLEQFWRVIEK